MPEIHQLTALDTLAATDQFPVYSDSNNDARKVSASVLAAFVIAQLDPAGDDTAYALDVVGTTFSTTVAPAAPGANVYALLDPADGFTTGTITLPGVDARADGQEVLVSCTKAIAALTVSGNGVTVNGAPTVLGANGFFRMRFDLILNAWYRIG